MDKCKKILSHKTIDIDDIPDIPLYMDQVTDYMDTILSSFKMEENDKILTKTMINNYVKDKIIEKPDKKKYTKSQLMELIMIYHLKNIISIGELKNLFEIEKKEEDILDSDKTNDDIKHFYSVFSDIQKDVIDTASSDFDDFLKSETFNSNSSKIQYILKLILKADINKRLAEIMIRELSNNNS